MNSPTFFFKMIPNWFQAWQTLLAYLLWAAVGHAAVHLPGGWVVGVDMTLAGHKLPADEVLQH